METNNLFRKLRDIMIMDDFMDVTLVCDDRTEFRAHRNILSAFSSVLNQLFLLNAKSNQSVVFLRGIKQQEMKSILNFIYLGEVSFNQSRMDEFLAVADILDIKELKESFTKSKVQTFEEDSSDTIDEDDVDFEDNDTSFRDDNSQDKSKDQEIMLTLKDDSSEKIDDDVDFELNDTSFRDYECSQDNSSDQEKEKRFGKLPEPDGLANIMKTEDETKYPIVPVSPQKRKTARRARRSNKSQEEDDNGRILTGQFTTDLLIQVLDRVTSVIMSQQISWEKLSKRHFKNEIILPMIETGILPRKKGLKGLKDYCSNWNKRVQTVYYSYLKNTIDWVAELTKDEAIRVKDYLDIIKSVSQQFIEQSTESFCTLYTDKTNYSVEG